jgi:hypothetical protein
MAIDYFSESERKKVLDQILTSEENLRRKESSLIKFEMYSGRQHPFVLNKIAQELGADAVKNSRTISSINIVKKLINEQASIYKKDPYRSFLNANDAQKNHLELLYMEGAANVKLKKANRIYKALSQSNFQVVLKNGKIEFRPLWDHHYDVIPKVDDPEVAECVITSSFDKSRIMQSMQKQNRGKDLFGKSYFSDRVNQKIGDPDDYAGKEFFYWWTDELNFITDKTGKLIDQIGREIGTDQSMMLNPIQKLPFVDIAQDKDFEYFVRGGSQAFSFNLDLLLMLSDISEINRLQGFSQAVIASTEEPKDLRVGPRRVLFLKIKPNSIDSERPSFQFVSPNPDLASSLKLLSDFTSLFLTSESLSPKLVNTAGEKETYSSGIDRFLAGIERHEVSMDDYSLFNKVESDVFDLIRSWNNVYYDKTENGFMDKLSGVHLPDDIELKVDFSAPQMVLNEKEELEMIEKKLDMGLISPVEAIMMDRGVDEVSAKKIWDSVSSDIDAVIDG